MRRKVRRPGRLAGARDRGAQRGLIEPGEQLRHQHAVLRRRQRLDDRREQVVREFEVSVASRLLRAGDWHSHPVRDPIPSDADLAAWARHSEEAGVLPYAGVIVTPGEVGWMSPEFHGWITREDDRGLLVCEPGRIDERFG